MKLEWDKTKESLKVILDNNFGITDLETLEQVERVLSKTRLCELEQLEKVEEIVFDKKYLLSVHKYLFQDIYPWAGQVREVEMIKGLSGFCPFASVEKELNNFFYNLKKDNYLQGFTFEEISELTSYYLIDMNYIHPFREGNGRSKRHFFSQLLKHNKYDFVFDKVDYIKMTNAEIEAFQYRKTKSNNPNHYKALVKSCLKPIFKQSEINTAYSKQEELNRFLWVYDRFDNSGWFSSNLSLKDAELKLNNLLSTEQGKVNIETILDRIIKNEEELLNRKAKYRKNIIKQAKNYQKEIDLGKINSNGLDTEEKKTINSMVQSKVVEKSKPINLEELFDPKKRPDSMSNYLKNMPKQNRTQKNSEFKKNNKDFQK